MSRLILSTAMTVDGVTTVGEWYVSEGEHDGASRDQFVDAAGMVMGRKTYEGLAGYWPTQTGEWADLLNPMPKFVASRSLEGALEWNATLIEGDGVDGVEKLKEEHDGDLVLIGCGDFARQLLERGLIDELRFWVHPAMWGSGERPLEGEQSPLELLGVEDVRLGCDPASLSACVAPCLRASRSRSAGSMRPGSSSTSTRSRLSWSTASPAALRSATWRRSHRREGATCSKR